VRWGGKQAAKANKASTSAEEQDRLELSLDVIEAVLSDLHEGWDGFGVVVQAYGCPPPVINFYTVILLNG
jgi:proline dehydrogenase